MDSPLITDHVSHLDMEEKQIESDEEPVFKEIVEDDTIS